MKLYNSIYDNLKENLPDVSGKVFAITGTTSGTGYIAALTVGEKGGKVLCINRPSSRANDSLAKLNELVPNGEFVQIDCDLQDFESVKSAAKKIRESYDKIYCLANNAGVMGLPSKATKDGYDVQMQTNHLSHFILTAELYPLIKAAAAEYGDARIVHHTSIARNGIHTETKFLEEKYLRKNGGKEVLGDDELNVTAFSGGQILRYKHSKLANSVMMHALDDRLKGADKNAQKIKSIAAHPGVSMTGLGTHLPSNFVKRILFKLFTGSPEDATTGLLTAMMMPDAESGGLYGPKGNAYYGPPVNQPPFPWEIDQACKDMVWNVSSEECGVQFVV